MSDSYPAGVTGNEFEIAGPDREWNATFPCEKCESSQTFEMVAYGYAVWGFCSVCESPLDESLVEETFYASDADYFEPDCFD